MDAFEMEQRRLSKKKESVDPIAVQAAQNNLQQFFEQMTEWEKLATQINDSHSPIIQEKVKAIFEQWATEAACTNRYNRLNAISYSMSPPHTYGSEQFVDVEQQSKNKILLFTKNHLNFQHRYTLLQKNGQWQVDKRQVFDGGWRNKGL